MTPFSLKKILCKNLRIDYLDVIIHLFSYHRDTARLSTMKRLHRTSFFSHRVEVSVFLEKIKLEHHYILAQPAYSSFEEARRGTKRQRDRSGAQIRQENQSQSSYGQGIRWVFEMISVRVSSKSIFSFLLFMRLFLIFAILSHHFFVHVLWRLYDFISLVTRMFQHFVIFMLDHNSRVTLSSLLFQNKTIKSVVLETK